MLCVKTDLSLTIVNDVLSLTLCSNDPFLTNFNDEPSLKIVNELIKMMFTSFLKYLKNLLMLLEMCSCYKIKKIRIQIIFIL